MGTLAEYVSIPNRFETGSVFNVSGDAPRYRLHEQPLAVPFIKDYDALESPLEWPRMFDVSNWAKVTAIGEDGLVGGAICAFDTPALEVLEGRNDLVALWDIRVHPSVQRQGIGAQLFRAARDWASSCGGKELRVETQNVNVVACRFYRRMGCKLVSARGGGYMHLPEEMKLLWSLTL